MLGFKQYASAYKFVAFAILALLLAMGYHWASTIGLFGLSLKNTNLQDDYGDVCTHIPGPGPDFSGVEDMTILSNFAFYFAHPYRRLFTSKDLLREFAQEHGLGEVNGPLELFKVLPETFRQPKIYYTDLNAVTAFPNGLAEEIHLVDIEGFDLTKYHEFFPLGGDSYLNEQTGKMYVNIVFVNRLGENVAQFEVVPPVAEQEIEQPVKRGKKGGSVEKLPDEPVQSVTKPATKLKLRLINVFAHDLFTSLNSVAMVSEDEFFVTNFISKSPFTEEFGALVEILLLKRKGSVLHCATSPSLLPTHPQTFKGSGSALYNGVSVEPTKFSRKGTTELHCYPLLADLGQPNGISVDRERKLVYIGTGISSVILALELGSFELVQQIPTPIGTDNVKVDYTDSHDLYIGNNPSMILVGKSMQDKSEKAPAVVYKLTAESIEYDVNELERKRKLATDKANGVVQNDDDILKVQEGVEPKMSTFYYLKPQLQTVYIDLTPPMKSTAPTALPIPSKFTHGKLQNMPQFRVFMSGAINDQGIDVCRVIV